MNPKSEDDKISITAQRAIQKEGLCTEDNVKKREEKKRQVLMVSSQDYYLDLQWQPEECCVDEKLRNRLNLRHVLNPTAYDFDM